MTKTVLICSFFDILSMFGILNLGHCDLTFDFAQDGGELVDPFGICDLLFDIRFFEVSFSIRLAVFQASGGAYRKIAGT